MTLKKEKHYKKRLFFWKFILDGARGGFRVARHKEKHAATLFIPLTALRSSPKEIQGSTWIDLNSKLWYKHAATLNFLPSPRIFVVPSARTDKGDQQQKKESLNCLKLSLWKVAMTYSPTNAARSAVYAVPAAGSHAKHRNCGAAWGATRRHCKERGGHWRYYAKKNEP